MRYCCILDGNTLVREQSEQFNKIDLVKFGMSSQLLRKSRLCRKNLDNRLDTNHNTSLEIHTMLFEKRVSSRFADRLMEENARMMSTKEL